MRSGTGRLSTSLQPGMQPEPQKLRKLMFIGTSTGMVSATSRPPSSAARSPARELARHALGLAGVDGEHVPVERAVGRGADLRRAARSRRRRTGRGSPARCPRAWCPRARRSPRTARGARRASPTGWRPAGRRRRCASTTAWSRSRARRPSSDRAELGAHRGELLGRGLAADGVGAHHVAAERAVADEEAGVDRDAALEPVEVLAEGLPLPGDALLERGERHALDLGHHPAQVVGVAGRAAARGVKPQLPPITVVTPCTLDGLAVGSQNSWAS